MDGMGYLKHQKLTPLHGGSQRAFERQLFGRFRALGHGFFGRVVDENRDGSPCFDM